MLPHCNFYLATTTCHNISINPHVATADHYPSRWLPHVEQLLFVAIEVVGDSAHGIRLLHTCANTVIKFEGNLVQ